MIARIRSLLHNLFRRTQVERRLDEELESCIEILTREKIAKGLLPVEARRQARIELGSLANIREDVREVRMGATIESAYQDIKYAFRMLSRNAGATIVTVFTLALGIGINTAVFTIYKAVFDWPLDARAPAEMVNLALVRDSGAREVSFSHPDYEVYRDSLRSFTGLIAYRSSRLTLSNVDATSSQRASAAGSVMRKLGVLGPAVSNAEFASVAVVSENYFEVLGVKTLQGRAFESISAHELATTPSVLISENYWQRRFARDPAIVGKTIRLNDAAVTVVGITPRDFVGTAFGVPAFWVPIGIEPLLSADNKSALRYRLFGRLASGVTIAEAQAELSVAGHRLRTLDNQPSDLAKPIAALVWPGSPFPLPLKNLLGLDAIVFLVMIATGIVLAVACANVGSLQLGRARAREDELRTRMSLGAGRGRVIRQLLTENGLVGLLAGAAALFLSWALLKVAVLVISNALPAEYASFVFDVTPDVGVFLFVSAISVIAGLVSGLAPAMESSRTVLASTGKNSTSSRRSRRLQDVLVAAQVTLSLFLLIFASMAVRSAMNSLAMDTGYDTRRVVAINFQFPETAKYDSARKQVLAREFRERIAALPGVADLTSAKPPAGTLFRTTVRALDSGTSSTQTQSMLYYGHVQSNYFQVLNIPIVAGNSFQENNGQPEFAVILSESAARQLWPGENPIGRSVRVGPTDERSHTASEMVISGPAYEVVGIAGDTRGSEMSGIDSKRIYLPMPANRLESYPILLRTRSDPEQVVEGIDTVISSIDPNMMASVSTLGEMLRTSAPFLASSVAAAVASVVGAFGLLLALMGIYGTVSYIVVLRTREVGIRIAVGAQKRDVLRLILAQGGRPVFAGLFAAVLFAIGISYPARKLLYGLNGIDVVSIAGMSLLFLGIASLASYLPARRATIVDPMVALRCE